MPLSAPTAREPTRAESRRAKRKDDYTLGVNSYDRVSSLLVSLLVMAGVTVAALSIIFFARRFVTIPAPIPVLPFDPAERPTDAALGVAEDIEPPGIEDAPELAEPALMDTLNSLTNELSSKVAILSDQALDGSDQVGRGSGLGDSRTAGGGGGAPEPRRELRFEFADIDNYARWYDFHKIELASFLQSTQRLKYASNLASPSPTVREGPASAETRYRFFSASGPLSGLDRRLADKAGISQGRDLLVQFFPNEAYARLLGLEQAQARKAGKQIGDIRQTAFRVEAKGSGFDFVVEEQLYY